MFSRCKNPSHYIGTHANYLIVKLQQQLSRSSSTVVALPPYCRLRDLSKKLKVPLNKIEKKCVVKRRKRFYTKFDDIWFSFETSKSIIIPFENARSIAEYFGKETKMIPFLEPPEESDLYLTRQPV